MAGLKILEVAHHRNGCGGEPFYAVRFLDGSLLLLAFVFEQPRRLVVIDPVLAADTVAFGQNSWRGDRYESELRTAIDDYEDARAIDPSSGDRSQPVKGGSLQ